MIDASGSPIAGGGHRAKIDREHITRTARNWIGKDDFLLVCSNADIHEDYVRKEMARRIAIGGRDVIRARVFEAYNAGHTSSEKIAEATGLHLRAISVHLNALIGEGRIAGYERTARAMSRTK